VLIYSHCLGFATHSRLIYEIALHSASSPNAFDMP
jgi:hypothetical protein